MTVFDSFVSALAIFETEDRQLYEYRRNRISLTHALAVRLSQVFAKQSKALSADICLQISKSKKTINPDILVHDRHSGKQVLAVVCRNEYLSEEEQKALMVFAGTDRCELVMAVSFFPQKNYMLLYRATASNIEYYHFDRNTLTSETVRKRTEEKFRESKSQLVFKLS